MVHVTPQDELLIDVTSKDGSEVISKMTMHISNLLYVSRKLPDVYGEEVNGNPLSGFRITLHSPERIVVLYATARDLHREWILWLDDRIVSAKSPTPHRFLRSSSAETNNSSVAGSTSQGAQPALHPSGDVVVSRVHRPIELFETSRPFPGHMLWTSNPQLREAFPDLTLAQHEVIRRLKSVSGPGTWSEIGQADPFALDEKDNMAFNGSQPWVRERYAPTEYLSNVQGLRTAREELQLGTGGPSTPTFAAHMSKWASDTSWIDMLASQRREKLSSRNEAKRLLLRRLSSLRVAMPGRESEVDYDEDKMMGIEEQVAQRTIPLPRGIGPLEVPLFWEEQYDDTKATIAMLRETFAKRLRQQLTASR
jgi:hypothetical protein